jgi:3-methyladenine DNA glycosylase/8-oxoguanine DNA glycosylase
MISNSELVVEDLSNLHYDELFSLLKPITGVGEWTIQALSIASLQDFSVFPYGDLAIQNVLGNILNKGKRLTKAEVEEFSDECGKSGPMVLYLIMSAYVLGWIN